MKNFFKSIGRDFVDLIKNHWLRILGFLIMYCVPAFLLISNFKGANFKVEKTNLIIILFLVVLVLIYWTKLRKYIRNAKREEKLMLRMDKDKAHSFVLFFSSLFDLVIAVASAFIVYWLVKVASDSIQKSLDQVENALQVLTKQLRQFFLITAICVSTGAVCFISDTIMSISRAYTEPKETTIEENTEEKTTI